MTEQNPEVSNETLDLMSPILTDSNFLKKFPPSLVQVSEWDPLRDHGIAYAIKLASAGVDCVL